MEFSEKEKSSCGVYRIVSPAGSCYIGMTTRTFAERWGQHLSDFRLKKGRCLGLHRAFAKYGIENMTFEILEEMTGRSEKTILRKEKEWWLRYKTTGVNLYNGEPSGKGSVIHSKETREKISKALKRNDGVKRNASGHRLYERKCVNTRCCKEYLSPRANSVFCSAKCKRLQARESIDISELLELRKEGRSLRALGKTYNVSYETIRRILLDHTLVH